MRRSRSKTLATAVLVDDAYLERLAFAERDRAQIDQLTRLDTDFTFEVLHRGEVVLEVHRPGRDAFEQEGVPVEHRFGT
jgi:hypothetical protein